MKFHRIEPFPHETFYVLADEDQDVDRIANDPVCFTPISYKREEVDPGDIPAHAKIVFIESESSRIKRVNLETAIRISEGAALTSVNDVSVAVEALKAAFQRNGLSTPLSIQLENPEQAAKLALMFGDRLTPSALSRLVHSISTNRDDFLIGGIRFTWPKPPEQIRKAKLQRLQQIFGAGGDLGSPSEENAS